MVFGFGKKKTIEASPDQPEQKKQVTLKEIPSLIRDLEAPRLATAVMEAAKFKMEIEKCLENIRGVILQLEKDNLKLDEIDKNLKTIGKRGKDAVVSTIKKETGARLPNIGSYDDVIGLNNEVSQILKRIGDILGLHTRVMHVFARKYADKLKEEISALSRIRSMLHSMISDHENFKSDYNSALETMEKIRVLDGEHVQKVRRVAEISGERDQLLKAIEDLEAEISKMISGDEYRQFLEVKKMIQALDNDKTGVKERVDAQFSKISRPLNKYTYVSAFDKHMKKIMEDMIADPYQVILPENKAQIVEILNATTKSVMAGNVSVKDAEKSVELIEETIESLDGFLALKDELASKKAVLESRLGVFDSKKLEQKEKDLQKARANLAELEAMEKKLEEEINQNRVSLQSVKSELENVVSRLTNAKTEILFKA